MNKRQCFTAAHRVCVAAGFPSFHDLHNVVICQGFTGQTALSLEAFDAAQSAFHTAQALRWAGEAVDAPDRARWVRHAARRSFLAWLLGHAATATA